VAILLSGTGGLYTRLGRILGAVSNANGYLSTAAPSPASAWGASGPTINDLADQTNNIEAQFQSSNQQIIDLLYTNRDSVRSALTSWKSYLRGMAQQTLITMANDDVKLSSLTVTPALQLLISQMTTNGNFVTSPTVSASAAAGGSNAGDGVMAVSILTVKGKNEQYFFNETLTATCTSDSQQSSGLLGHEPFSCLGVVPQSDPLAFNWPLGSGSSAGLTAVNPTTSANLLTNSNFESWTVSNTPDSWTIVVGAAGTDIFRESTVIYTGSFALRYTGTGGAPLTEIYESVTLRPSTVYQGCVWLRKSAGLAAGVLQMDLHNGTTTINDDAATANSKTQTLSALSSSAFTAVSFTFVTPATLPAITRFRIKATTALTSGESVYIDQLSFVPAASLYQGGPWGTVFSGATKFLIADTFSITASNDYAGKWQLNFEKIFSMRSLGLQLPYTGSSLLADSLIA